MVSKYWFFRDYYKYNYTLIKKWFFWEIFTKYDHKNIKNLLFERDFKWILLQSICEIVWFTLIFTKFFMNFSQNSLFFRDITELTQKIILEFCYREISSKKVLNFNILVSFRGVLTDLEEIFMQFMLEREIYTSSIQ